MFKVYLDEEVFHTIDMFLESVRKYYKDFYDNTGLTVRDQILQMYDNKHLDMKENILGKIIHLSKTGVVGRKVLKYTENIEKSSYIFMFASYKIKFWAEKNIEKQEITIIKLEIKT